MRYGLSLEDYRERIEQPCAICGQKRPRMAIDHDHKTGAVRGTLCNTCNTGIGLLGDDPDRCIQAAEYLRRCAR